MGRHSLPPSPLRRLAQLGAAVALTAAGIVVALGGHAHADTPSCADDTSNPDVHVCRDATDTTGSGDGLHAVVKANPLVCAHIIIRFERLIGTGRCPEKSPVVVIPTTPPAAPCSCVVTPSPPVVTAPARHHRYQLPAAPTPVIVNGDQNPVPVVTH